MLEADYKCVLNPGTCVKTCKTQERKTPEFSIFNETAASFSEDLYGSVAGIILYSFVRFRMQNHPGLSGTVLHVFALFRFQNHPCLSGTVLDSSETQKVINS